MILAISVVIALIICNVIYCGQHIMRDLGQSRMGQGVWGMIALSGAFTALAATVGIALASLAHY